MAVNDSRSMNADLHSGVNDGRFKNLTPDRGGNADTSHAATRSNLLQNQYNITDFMGGIAPKVMDHDYEMGYAED
jgi:hypothetical protein